jgi:protease-4
MPKKRNTKWWILGGAAALFALGALTVAGFALAKAIPEIKAYTPVGKKIAVLDLRGPITSSEGLIKIIHDYRDDPTVAAVVVYIDSPGGSVTASNELYTELIKLKKKDKKVYAYMSTVAASGGYYVACAADKIYANPGTLTGSIGVIMMFTNMEGLFGKVGLSVNTIKSGRYKDIGSPYRPMTPEEEALLGETVDDIYQQFVDIVVASRRKAIETKLRDVGEKMPTGYRVKTYVMDYADGRIFTGREAAKLGFVDKLGNFETCIDAVAADVGIKGKPTIIRKRLPEPSLYDVFFGGALHKVLHELQPSPGVEIKYSLY